VGAPGRARTRSGPGWALRPSDLLTTCWRGFGRARRWGLGGAIGWDRVPELRRQIVTHRRFKRLVDQWIGLSIGHSRPTMRIAECKAA
jgi:hypothetical protein